jgi:hypothetical protein
MGAGDSQAKWPAQQERAILETARPHRTPPIRALFASLGNAAQTPDCVVGPGGLEPPTSQTVRSDTAWELTNGREISLMAPWTQRHAKELMASNSSLTLHNCFMIGREFNVLRTADFAKSAK